MEKLPRTFYDRDTVEVARALLGQHIVRILPNGARLVCRITETEAYIGRIDKACHAYGYRRTARTQTLFGPPGRAYIYLIYGLYHCLNFVTEPEGEPSAVLIRAAQPVENTDIIADNRFACKAQNMTASQRTHLLDGPGKLCMGLGLTRSQNGADLCSGDDLFVSPAPPPAHIMVGKRIGIDYAQEAIDFPWRFWIEK